MRWFDYIGSFIMPITFIVLGFVFWKHPPKEINTVSGWRTQRAMQNQETWDFANVLGGKCMLILGIIELFATGAFLLIASNLDAASVIVIQSACFAIVYIYVEKQLKKHFHQ